VVLGASVLRLGNSGVEPWRRKRRTRRRCRDREEERMLTGGDELRWRPDLGKKGEIQN
jgi:hypothetical protein